MTRLQRLRREAAEYGKKALSAFAGALVCAVFLIVFCLHERPDCMAGCLFIGGILLIVGLGCHYHWHRLRTLARKEDEDQYKFALIHYANKRP